jgi:uncharacterized protein (DUF3084 family)
MYGFALIAILIITGGAIAYIGDRIGMRVGRKRLTLFGLRPKYTSIVITIITGILIAGATMTVLVFVSADVRTALFKMNEIKSELAQTKSTLSQTQEEYRIVSAQIEVKVNEYAELVDKYQVLTMEYDAMSDQYQNLTTEYLSLSKRYNDLSSEYQILSDAYTMLDNRFVDLGKRYDELSSDYSSLLLEYNTLSSEYNSLTTKYEQLTNAYSLLTLELNKTVEERDKINADLDKTIRELETTEEVLDNLLQVKEELTTTVEELREEKTRLETAFLSLWTGLEGMLGGDVVFRSGEIILATVIECGRPIEEIEQDILMFLIEANNVALKRGARIEGEQGNAIWFDVEDLDSVYRELSTRIQEKAVVRLISATNTIQGDAVWAYFQVFPNELIFEKGEIIVERTLINSKAPGAIQYDLFAMLAEANSVAIERGMITDEQGTVGRVVSMQDFQAAMSQIASSTEPVTVYVVVVSDTYRAEGPLDVKFFVELATFPIGSEQ